MHPPKYMVNYLGGVADPSCTYLIGLYNAGPYSALIFVSFYDFTSISIEIRLIRAGIRGTGVRKAPKVCYIIS